MVTVERLKPFEKYRSPNGLGRPFHSSIYSDFHSLLDIEEDLLKRDMEFGFTSLLPPSYHSLRHGGNYMTNRFSNFDRTNFHESPHTSSDVKVIPIKVEHYPEDFHEQRNTRFRLLNGSHKQTEAQREDPTLSFSRHVPEFSSNSSSSFLSTSPKDQENHLLKNTSDVEKRTNSDANKYELASNISCPSFHKRHSSHIMDTESDSHEGKADTWKPIPVQHVDSLNTPVLNKKPNINNNSSEKNGFPLVPFNSSEVNANLESDVNISSDTSSKNLSINTLPSMTNSIFDLEAEEQEINIPPSYPIYDILKVKLAQENRKIDYIKGDGNCFFRALSKGLYNSERYYNKVRSFVVDVIATNKSQFAQFVDEEDVQEHVRRMSEDHCWATTCEIYAAATLLQKDIFMLTPDHLNENYSWLLFRPVFKLGEHHNNITNHPCYITLCNTNGNHYDRIVPDHGGCNCFLPHPELGVVGTSSV